MAVASSSHPWLADQPTLEQLSLLPPATALSDISAQLPVNLAEDGIEIPSVVAVRRSDPVYNAHSYLTKVPVAAVAPFVMAFTSPNELVLDPFAGSGMTGVAAALLGRRAELRDISVLGRHIGRNYVNLVDTKRFSEAVATVISAAEDRLKGLYDVRCEACGSAAQLSRTVWSKVFECASCRGEINYYRALEAAGWSKSQMQCPTCAQRVRARGLRHVRDEAVLDTLRCECTPTLADQPPAQAPDSNHLLSELEWPDVRIDASRQMFYASALSKHGLESVASFFSARNLAALAALREEILKLEHEELREKLLFAFTAILARASKRYQWSRKRPLNAATQNYYIAPVFYEWNVFDLFGRKAAAVQRSDKAIRAELRANGLTGAKVEAVRYQLGSAACLDLQDESVDYVFTDPPFGSNIFYSDMNLFHEAWLGEFTDPTNEAVVDREPAGGNGRSAARYESLITDAMKECHRVLKPGKWLSLVFSNSSGEMWALLQRAIGEAGFVLEALSVLDKGQRSVKGLNSGTENVVTFDLVLSMRKCEGGEQVAVLPAPDTFFDQALELELEARAETPSHAYLGVVRRFLRHHYDVAAIDLATVSHALTNRGYSVDERSGRIQAQQSD